MLGQATLEAFADELQKIAVASTADPGAMEKMLKPGDILLTKPRRLSGITQRTMRPFLKAFQGTEYTHTGLYAGEGNVIDSGLWKGKAKVTKVPLAKFMDRYEFKVLRVHASSAEKKDAVAYAQDQVGKPFSLLKMVRLALPTGEVKGPRQREEAAKLFCSELIANAYHHQNFAAGKSTRHVRPVDIHRSPLTKTVAEFK